VHHAFASGRGPIERTFREQVGFDELETLAGARQRPERRDVALFFSDLTVPRTARRCEQLLGDRGR
jgi:hypothetical protein